MAHAAHFEEHRRGLSALLIGPGGDVNSRHPDNSNAGNTPLHYVARKGDEPGVRMLLGNGEDPDLVNTAGQRAIDLTKNNIFQLSSTEARIPKRKWELLGMSLRTPATR